MEFKEIEISTRKGGGKRNEREKGKWWKFVCVSRFGSASRVRAGIGRLENAEIWCFDSVLFSFNYLLLLFRFSRSIEYG